MTRLILTLVFALLISILIADRNMDAPEGISYVADQDIWLVSCWNSANVVAVKEDGTEEVFTGGLPHCANNLLVDQVLFLVWLSHYYVDLLLVHQGYKVLLSYCFQFA